ncbi:MAG TPA: hypothetical protein VEJ18_20300 [Planctomycetota bacterium]|nr:hypothetical protein [Planctomycetota bacterium]
MSSWSHLGHGGGELAAKQMAHYVNGFQPAALNAGTDTTPVAGTVYYGSLYIPFRMLLTGAGYNIGSVGGTDSAIVSLYDTAGKLIASSALAGTLVGTANTMQEIAFTATAMVDGPGVYHVGVSVNGTTCRLRLGVANGSRGGSQVGAFGTLDAITTVPVSNAAAPIAYVY